MKKKSYLNLFIICSILILIQSCKKNDIILNNTVDNSLKSQKNEIAYPNINGEIIKLNYNGINILVEKKADRYVWLGDIAFDQKTFDSLKKSSNSLARTFRPTLENHWAGGQVNYFIGSGFTSNEINSINNAISDYVNNTSLTFYQLPSIQSNTNYVLIRKGLAGSGFYSDFIGKKGGQQIINLESGFTTGTAIHELGHVIGFYHEQSRTDRDNSIIINPNNFQPGQNVAYQFQTYAQRNEPGSQIGAFDFNSIMLYDSYAFSANGNPTITKLDGSTYISNRFSLSVGDIETTSFIYGPPFARIEQDITVNNSEYGYAYDLLYQEADVYVRLYSDVACTIPFVTNINKDFNYTRETYLFTYPRPSETILQNGTYFVPAGSSEILLEQGLVITDFYSEFGDIKRDNRKSFIPKNVFFR